jgi:biopolymer transport protein ExbD
MKIRLAQVEEDDQLDITPMIDVIFLLVLFFMVTSTFIEEAKVFKMLLPRADNPTTVAREDADSISLTVEGQLFFRQGSAKEKEIKDLAALVEQLRTQDRTRPVIIRCDARCEYRQFVEVKNALRLAGVEIIFEEVEVGHASQ